MSSRGVGILCLHARPDDFVGDDAIAEAARRLRDAGHRVSILSSVQPDGDQAGWYEELRRWTEAAELDLAVVVRAWDSRLIDAVRSGLTEGSRVARLAAGAPSSLDAQFDAVVDLGGLIELLADRKPSPPRIPNSARELRALRIVPHEITPESLAIEGRPRIRGPAVGCPFLADARRLPIFAGLGLERETVQTKGCTFCLDNIGTYVAPATEEVVASWLTQTRAVRSLRPQTRELLLVDERPHPHLPAFFAAIAEEPALFGIELMIKSRVDWLIEHEQAIVSAIEAARRSRSVLHVYLVGFESFAPSDLVLFNKGVDVAQNLLAIEKLRELGERYGDAFEYRKFRAHGIVLFSPWTTPATLATNARVMREVRFSELRTESLRTRLRLYPRTPLHALAVRDGLIVDALPEGRVDRSREQGYDASVPWRFADPVVESIFQASNALLAFGRSLPEPDILEAAIALLTLSPSLAEHPTLAALPLKQVVAEQRALFDRSASLQLNPRIVQLLERKGGRLAQRCRIDEGAEFLAQAYRAMGLCAEAFSPAVVIAGTPGELLPPRPLPKLPASIVAGASLGPRRIARIVPDVEMHHVVIDEMRMLVLQLRAHDPGTPYTLRCGRWALDVEAPERLTEDDKHAIGVLVRMLLEPDGI